MTHWRLAGALVVWCLLTCPRASAAADDATTFRVFLKDGGTLVSYGEMARVGDRVIFSMPTGSAADSPLHLVNIAADRVDWERTERYAVSARSVHYFATQAENDYTALSDEVAQTLNQVASVSDVVRRLAIVEQARAKLAEWPSKHYNYREADVRQLLGLLDEAIADLRAAAGGARFDLNLVAYSDQPAPIEALLPPLTPREAIEQTLRAAKASDLPADRSWLLQAVVDGLAREAQSLPSDWAAATWVATRTAIDHERRLDRDYQSLTGRMTRLAETRARAADVRGVQRVLERIQSSDASLGNARPDVVQGLIAEVEEKLDAARRLRLARDRFALRQPVLVEYRAAIRAPMDRFARLKPALEDIKSLAGSSPSALAALDDLVAQIVKLVSEMSPPDELTAAHALFVSAAYLAANAAQIRREATMSNDLARAWDASSAAAGALMLGAKARSEIQALLRPPQLR